MELLTVPFPTALVVGDGEVGCCTLEGLVTPLVPFDVAMEPLKLPPAPVAPFGEPELPVLETPLEPEAPPAPPKPPPVPAAYASPERPAISPQTVKCLWKFMVMDSPIPSMRDTN